MADYTKDSIFEKNLLMLLPFYIMWYEKKGHDFNNNPQLFQILLNEYEEIRISLEKELTETGRSELYTDLTKLIVKIADYIFQKEEDIRKGIGEIMGGKVLELESERLKAEGKAIGQAQGENRLGSLITMVSKAATVNKAAVFTFESPQRWLSYRSFWAMHKPELFMEQFLT